MSDTITCPNCHHAISLSDIQSHQMSETLKEREKLIEAEMKKKAFGWAQDEVKKAKAESEESSRRQTIELESLRKRDEEARQKEMEFLRKSQEFEMRHKNLELEKEKALIAERKRLEEEFAMRVKSEQSVEMERMRLDYDKRLAEEQKKAEILKKSLDDAQMKANQGSMQIQGEIQENALRDILTRHFAIDIVDDIATGAKGADLIQNVRDNLGQTSGVIVWESKNTKGWSDGWVDKLKEDRLRVKADIAVIVSAVLPGEVKHFGLYKWVWVTEWAYVIALTSTLREQILQLNALRLTSEGKEEKMEVLYNYLTSETFKGKVENIIEAFTVLKEDLDSERRAMEKRWKQREMQLERVIGNTAGLYGDFAGIIGKQLPSVKYLELESWDL